MILEENFQKGIDELLLGKRKLLYLVTSSWNVRNAVTEQVRRVFADRCFCSTEVEFAEEMIHYIRNGTLAEFRREMVAYDCVILSDLQYIEGKEATQQELYLILCKRLEQGKTTLLFSVHDLTSLDMGLKTLLDEIVSRQYGGSNRDNAAAYTEKDIM